MNRLLPSAFALILLAASPALASADKGVLKSTACYGFMDHLMGTGLAEHAPDFKDVLAAGLWHYDRIQKAGADGWTGEDREEYLFAQAEATRMGVDLEKLFDESGPAVGVKHMRRVLELCYIEPGLSLD